MAFATNMCLNDGMKLWKTGSDEQTAAPAPTGGAVIADRFKRDMDPNAGNPNGAIRVSVRDGTVTVTGPAKGRGVLVWNGEKRPIAPGETVTVR